VFEPPEERPEPADVEEAPPSRGRRGRPTPAPLAEAGLFEGESVEAEIEGSDVEAAAVPEVRPDEAEEASEEVTDEQTGKRRRRRRSRRKKPVGEPGAEAMADAASEPMAEETPVPSADDDDDEPTAEVVKNWNVPSWDELIGSLHRPER
jgi:hypothetical protein